MAEAYSKCGLTEAGYPFFLVVAHVSAPYSIAGLGTRWPDHCFVDILLQTPVSLASFSFTYFAAFLPISLSMNV